MTDLIPIELVREPMGSRQTILLPRSASLDSDSVQTPTFKGRVAAIFPDLMEVGKIEAVPLPPKQPRISTIWVAFFSFCLHLETSATKLL